MALSSELKVGQSMAFRGPSGGEIKLTLVEKSGQRARLSIEADQEITIINSKQFEKREQEQKLTAPPLTS